MVLLSYFSSLISYSLFVLLTFATLTQHELYMNRCIELAALGAGYTAPNPMVGAVLVYNDEVIGEGHHEQYGQAHAEVNCLKSVKEDQRHLISESTLYVSLEPCAHFGKTPPCADLIIHYKIPRVVIGCRDSFAKVNGQGIQKLKDAGIKVTEGIVEKKALELNKRFFCFHKNKRPYIILKWAQTADGFIAKKNFDAIPISNAFSNRWVHKMRAEEAAIIIGAHTALHDKPALTTRNWPGKNPARIFIDKQLRIDLSASLFDNNAPVIVINELKEQQQDNIHFFKIEKDRSMLPQLMHLLYQQNINSLIVEGGSTILQSFILEQLWDEAYVITNTTLQLQEGIAAVRLPKEKQSGSFNIATDLIDHYKNAPGSI